MTNYSVLRHPVLHDEAVKRYRTVRRGFMFFLEVGASGAETQQIEQETARLIGGLQWLSIWNGMTAKTSEKRERYFFHS